MCARVYDSGQIVIRTHDHDQHNTGTTPDTPLEHTTGKERNTGNTRRPVYICLIAGNEKKYKKS